MPLVNTATKRAKSSRVRKPKEFIIDLKRNGSAIVAIMDRNEPSLVNLHVGDFENLKYCENKEENLFIENYKALIRFCLFVTDKPISECQMQRLNLFEVALVILLLN